MDKIRVLINKEWLELRTQRWLLFGIIMLPLILAIAPIILMYVMGIAPDSANTGSLAPMVAANPALQGLSDAELAQAIIGQQFSLLFLLLPLLLPNILASYSIVGEKTSRTLEPLLAAPITTWQLLLGKSLAALLPTAALTWLVGAVFIVGMRLTALSDQVFNAIISPGWLLVFLLCAPLGALISIAATVAVSSRVNDPRSAQQIAGLVVLPIVALVFAQLFGVLVLNPAAALVIAFVLAIVAALAIWLATRLFQREAILTRWT